MTEKLRHPKALDLYGKDFGHWLTSDLSGRYLAGDDHPPEIRARFGELFLAALPYAKLGVDLREESCHPGYSAEDCRRCAGVVRLRRALDYALP